MPECAICAAERRAAITAHLDRLGVPPTEQPTYTGALEQTPGVLGLLAECETREQLDHLTENGVVPDTYVGGASVDEDVRDERWRDAQS